MLVTGLPALRYAECKKLRQGQVVVTFGSRDGLSNSMSMGVIGSIARQPNPDSPFIRTDASVNPGDSGGPLGNASGEMVGLDTSIFSQSGGSEGWLTTVDAWRTKLEQMKSGDPVALFIECDSAVA